MIFFQHARYVIKFTNIKIKYILIYGWWGLIRKCCLFKILKKCFNINDLVIWINKYTRVAALSQCWNKFPWGLGTARHIRQSLCLIATVTHADESDSQMYYYPEEEAKCLRQNPWITELIPSISTPWQVKLIFSGINLYQNTQINKSVCNDVSRLDSLL